MRAAGTVFTAGQEVKAAWYRGFIKEPGPNRMTGVTAISGSRHMYQRIREERNARNHIEVKRWGKMTKKKPTCWQAEVSSI